MGWGSETIWGGSRENQAQASTAGDISNPCSASASSILRCSARSVLKLRVPVAAVAFERGGGSASDGGPSKCACIGGDRSARNIDSSGDFQDVEGAEQLLLILDVMPSASARIELLAIVASRSSPSVLSYSDMPSQQSSGRIFTAIHCLAAVICVVFSIWASAWVVVRYAKFLCCPFVRE